MSRISVKDAVKRYGNNTVIPDLNLEIGDGELFTLLGPSGCGKTTLLRMIAGFNSIEGGDIFFNEKRINELFSGMTQQKAEPGSVKQKISDLYKMGLDSVRLNAEGAAPIKAAVDGILAIGDRSQLTAAVARLHSSMKRRAPQAKR